MELYQFNQLDEAEQMEAIWYKSVRLAEREDEDFCYKLYQIDSFYVEEKFIKQDRIRIAFKAFATTNLLDPYLDKIKIDI